MTTTTESFQSRQIRQNEEQDGLNGLFEIADTITLKNRFRNVVQSRIDAKLVKYPQYAGYFNSHVLVQIIRDITTKAGECFKVGDIVLAKYETSNIVDFCGRWVAFSIRTNMNTVIDPSDIFEL